MLRLGVFKLHSYKLQNYQFSLLRLGADDFQLISLPQPQKGEDSFVRRIACKRWSQASGVGVAGDLPASLRVHDYHRLALAFLIPERKRQPISRKMKRARQRPR